MTNLDLLETNSWALETYYKDFNRFNNFFDDNKEMLTPHEIINLNFTNFEYPLPVDPEQDFVKFIYNVVSEKLPTIKINKVTKSWFVNYPPTYTNEAHTHYHGRHFTTILYLSDIYTKHIDQANGGSLWTFHVEQNNIVHRLYSYESGKVVLLGGNVWHGTYPTHSNRKVFVCDFEYEINGV